MSRRLFKRLQKCVKCTLREHVHLVNDIDLVFSHLWRYAHLISQRTDIIHRVIGSRIQFVDIIGALLVKSLARLTLIARFVLAGRVQTVDCFCEDAGAGCLAYPSRATEEIGMCQLVADNRILKSGRKRMLSNNRTKSGRSVFTGGNYIFFHEMSLTLNMKQGQI